MQTVKMNNLIESQDPRIQSLKLERENISPVFMFSVISLRGKSGKQKLKSPENP